ncbi:MAG: IS481 family transposase, partial [Acidobacteriota bacterium]
MQDSLDRYLVHYNTERAHQGRLVKGRTPYQVFQDGLAQPKKKGPPKAA